MVELTGTDKQIAKANELRDAVLPMLREELARHEARIAKNTAEGNEMGVRSATRSAERVKGDIHALETLPYAAWWTEKVSLWPGEGAALVAARFKDKLSIGSLGFWLQHNTEEGQTWTTDEEIEAAVRAFRGEASE